MRLRRQGSCSARVPAALFAAALAVSAWSCGGADSNNQEPPQSTQDAAEDVPGKDAGDASPEAKPDVAPDVNKDVAPEVKPDVKPDVQNEVGPDADAGEDAQDAQEEEACVPQAEVCNGQDEDCDGVVDNSPAGVGADCEVFGAMGPCATGKTKCDNGSLVCEQTVQPSLEICDGKDNDCNAVIDNDVSGSGDPCTVDGQQGACAIGATGCVSGSPTCPQKVFPASETCNGADDDCNGTVDDPSALDGLACTSSEKGICAPGKTLCTGGVSTCVPNVQPESQVETCNGLDDDCNGAVDDIVDMSADCAALLPAASNVTAWKCEAGLCVVMVCGTGFMDCDAAAATGCEIDTTATLASCGTCGNACSTINATPACVQGVCTLECATGYDDCDADLSTGCEQSLADSVSNCGACGKACDNVTGTPTCTSGVCHIACNAGRDDCNGNPDDGCEIDLQTDLKHCGTCTTECSVVNGTPACSAGKCSITCATGYADCDNDVATGCESNLTSDELHCGTCSNACSTNHGAPSCNNGSCSIVCATGYGNCDGNPATGCEVDFDTDVANCGSCGTPCSNAHGTPSCINQQCSISCSTGWGDCDSDVTSGCETDLTTTPAHCGGCGAPCSTNHGTASCANSLCSIACSPGWGDCDGEVSTGCEADELNDNQHCGTCTTVCSSSGGTPSCNNGACGIQCNPGMADCDTSPGCESNTNTSMDHCGGCGHVCALANANSSCSWGVCTLVSCNTGFANCNADPADGCETNLQTNVSSCGGCGMACSNEHGFPSCSGGACSIVCNASYSNCDGDARTNGCEAHLPTDVANCGTCGNACSTVHGTPTCANGVCGINCNTGWGNCTTAAGCETNIYDSTTSCGGCNQPCSANHTANVDCVSPGVCSYDCLAPWGDCDGSKATGCETDISSSSANCGACGNVCTVNASQHVSAATCSGSACHVLSCSSPWYDQDGVYGTGCECSADALPDSPSAAPVTTVALNTAGTFPGNLTPSPSDSDWFIFSFQLGPSCAFNPHIWVTGAGARLRAFTTAGATAGMTCKEGGASNKDGITEWEFTYLAGCGTYNPIDPYPGVGPFLAPLPSGVPIVVYVQVYAPSDLTTCGSYVLNYSN